jgi:hypothetical protein
MIPMLDWSAFGSDPDGFAETLGQICRDHGFFC